MIFTYIYQINWCRISSINSVEGLLPWPRDRVPHVFGDAGLLFGEPSWRCLEDFFVPYRQPWQYQDGWVFPKIGVPQNGWFISWKTLWTNSWFGGGGGVPLFLVQHPSRWMRKRISFHTVLTVAFRQKILRILGSVEKTWTLPGPGSVFLFWGRGMNLFIWLAFHLEIYIVI